MTNAHPETNNVAILLLAAGASSRMHGRDKLLEKVDGEPLLRKLASHACGVSDTVLVCLRAEDDARQSTLKGLECQTVVVKDASDGMAHSLRAGIAHLPERCGAVIVIPADMPELTQEDLATVVTAHTAQPDVIIRATSEDGLPGHPVIFPARLFNSLRALSGDKGARAILKQHAASIQLVKLPDSHALTDLDTPEAWAAWRAKGQK